MIPLKHYDIQIVNLSLKKQQNINTLSGTNLRYFQNCILRNNGTAYFIQKAYVEMVCNMKLPQRGHNEKNPS